MYCLVTLPPHLRVELPEHGTLQGVSGVTAATVGKLLLQKQ